MFSTKTVVPEGYMLIPSPLKEEEKSQSSEEISHLGESPARASLRALTGAARAARPLPKMGKGKKRSRQGESLKNDLALTSFSSTQSRPPKVARVALRYVANVTASAGGIVATVLGSDPSIAAGWSSWAASYEMFRVLKIQMTYQPYNKYDESAAAFSSPIIVINDYNAAAALASYTQAVEYEQLTFANSCDQFTHGLVLPSVSPYEDWMPTSAPVNHAYIKTFAAGLGNIQTCGLVVINFLVEFMGVD